MKKRVAVLTAVLLCLSVFTGCQKKDTTAETTATAKLVKAQAVQTQEMADGLTYIGVVKAKDTKNYSFLMAGKIASVNVKKGDKFKKGDVLATLDTKTLQYSADIGKNQEDTAKATLSKTEGTYDTNIASAKNTINTLTTAIAAGEEGITAGQKNIDAGEIAIAAGQKNIDAGEVSIEAGENKIETSQKELDAAQDALNTLTDNVNDARELNKVGGVSARDLEKAETELKTQQATYDGKVADLTSAKAELNAKMAELESSKATLNTKKAELEASRAKLEASKADVQKLIDQKKTAEETLNNLYESKADDLKAAGAAVSSAGISNEITQKNINDATVKADADGYVMELPYKEGEVIAAGYPVVVAKSTNMVVTVGVSDEDVSKVKVGGKALIKNGVAGTIETIAQYPDEATRTYAVDISVPEDEFTMGETVDVKIVTGEITGCYVPIDSVFNLDGVDYVYAINSEDKVYKKQVTMGSIDGDKVEVKIDDPTATIITEGVKSLRENDLVKVEGE